MTKQRGSIKNEQMKEKKLESEERLELSFWMKTDGKGANGGWR